ncbi:TLC domain-containing protein [Geopyxis carbonaria]|nr:TLC domain-containing protein [Geopyxis carbonaria]
MHIPSPRHDRLCHERSANETGLSSAIEERVHSGARRGDKGTSPRRRSSNDNGSRVDSQQRRRSNDSCADDTQVNSCALYFVRNQIWISCGILLCLGVANIFFPPLRPLLQRFHTLSYYNPSTQRYGKGIDDGYLVLLWIVAFTFLRASALEYVFIPLAKRAGISTPKGLARFAEQAWVLVYYSFFWTLGTYLIYHSPFWMNVEELWTEWPVRELGGPFKWYYLVQFAFWLQQIFVLNIEERRKDHNQMLAHHIITCSLMAASYAYHMTRIGTVILCLMDFVDILLPVAKLLKYMGYHTICDYAFGIFLIAWVITRHLLYNRIVYSAWKDSVRFIAFGCYSQNSSEPQQLPSGSDFYAIKHTFSYSNDVVCFTKTIQMSFIATLVALQLITLVWLYMIMHVAWRVVQGTGADDTRSDGEDELEEIELGEEVYSQITTNNIMQKPVDFGYLNRTMTTQPDLELPITNGNFHERISTTQFRTT